jgi:ABC-type nitrate/sulfonate/bicarbonate transport system ATPase subunit
VAPAAHDVTGESRSVETRGLSKSYKRDRQEPIVALEGVDLRAEPGQFVSVIGPSGCGKTTVFSVIAGLDEPSGGEVLIGGDVLADRLGVSAYMPQGDTLLGWRRIIDNVTLPLEIAGVRRREARRQALPLLERFGLDGFAHSWPWQLSGGMRQRVAVARALVARPGILLLDEPLGALDGITRGDLQQWLSVALAEQGSTVLLVTHDVTEAVFLSDRIYVMSPRPGRVVAELAIDLPRPRRLEDQETVAFVDLERRLRAELRATSWPAR